MKKIMSRLLALVFVSAFLITCSEEPSEFGLFEQHADIGECALPGNFVFQTEKDLYSIIGSGENMWFGADQLHFAWFETDKDFILRARMEFIGEGKNAHRKTGLMIRNSSDTSSVHVSGVVHGDGLTGLQYRKHFGEDMEEITSNVSAPDAIQLERKGDMYIFTVAAGGEISEPMILEGVSFDPGTQVGLFMCSHDNTVAEKANFMDVQIIYTGRKKYEVFETYVYSTDQ